MTKNKNKTYSIGKVETWKRCEATTEIIEMLGLEVTEEVRKKIRHRLGKLISTKKVAEKIK